MSMVVVRGARHRGRIVSSRDAEWVREVLTSAGFGWKGRPGAVTRTRLQVWSSPEALPADWPPESRSPAPGIAVGYETFWFEADYQQDQPYVVLGDYQSHRELGPSWVVADIGPYCWLEPDISPPMGLTWCPGVVPSPDPKTPDVPLPMPDISLPTQPVQSTPEPKSSTSSWLVALAIAVPLVVGAVVIGREVGSRAAAPPGRRRLAV
jgi:hypothetical protein